MNESDPELDRIPPRSCPDHLPTCSRDARTHARLRTHTEGSTHSLGGVSSIIFSPQLRFGAAAVPFCSLVMVSAAAEPPVMHKKIKKGGKKKSPTPPIRRLCCSLARSARARARAPPAASVSSPSSPHHNLLLPLLLLRESSVEKTNTRSPRPPSSSPPTWSCFNFDPPSSASWESSLKRARTHTHARTHRQPAVSSTPLLLLSRFPNNTHPHSLTLSRAHTRTQRHTVRSLPFSSSSSSFFFSSPCFKSCCRSRSLRQPVLRQKERARESARE